MAEIKSAQADAYIERPDPQISVFLLYGPDSGLVSERAGLLAIKFGIDQSDPFAVLRMDADMACSEPGKLADEAAAVGMFGGQWLIRISGSTRRNLGDALRPILENPPIECRLIIEAGDLKRDSALRKLVERSPTGMAIPCYLDGERELDRLITTVLQSAGLTIDPDTRATLRASLGSDRRLSRNELEKLAMYSAGNGRVTVQDIHAVVGDSSASDSDDAVDAVATGNVEKLAILMPRLLATVPADMLLVWTMRHFQSIQLARFRMEREHLSAEAAVAGVRPPPSYLRRPAIVTSLKLWSLPLVERALARLDGAALDTRKNPAVGRSLAEATLFAVAGEAARVRSRRTRGL